MRAQVWIPQHRDRCFVDPHTTGRADLYTVYSHGDGRPGEDDDVALPAPLVDGRLGRGTGHRKELTNASSNRRLTDRSPLVVGTPQTSRQRGCLVLCPSPYCLQCVVLIPAVHGAHLPISINITCTLMCAGSAYLLPTGVISVRQYRMCIAAAPDYVDFAIKLSP